MAMVMVAVVWTIDVLRRMMDMMEGWCMLMGNGWMVGYDVG